MALKQIIINGEAYVPRKHVEEALLIIAEYSELYDCMRDNPSEPSREEKRAQSKLDTRWDRLAKRVTGS